MILKRVIKTGNQVTRRVCRYRLWSLLFPSPTSAPESVRVCVFSSGVTETCGQGSVLKRFSAVWKTDMFGGERRDETRGNIDSWCWSGLEIWWSGW